MLPLHPHFICCASAMTRSTSEEGTVVHDNPLHEGASDELVGDGTGSTVWGTAVDRPVHLIPAYGHIGPATIARAAELRASSPVFTSVSSPLPLAGPSLPARSSSACVLKKATDNRTAVPRYNRRKIFHTIAQIFQLWAIARGALTFARSRGNHRGAASVHHPA